MQTVLVSRIFVTLIWYAPLCPEMPEASGHFNWHKFSLQSIGASLLPTPFLASSGTIHLVMRPARSGKWNDSFSARFVFWSKLWDEQKRACSWRWWEGQDSLFRQKPSFVCGNIGKSSLRCEPLLSLPTRPAHPSRRVWWRAGATNIPNRKNSRSLKW